MVANPGDEANDYADGGLSRYVTAGFDGRNLRPEIVGLPMDRAVVHAANDMPYNQVFPYLATPHAGPTVNQRQCPP